MSLPVLLYHHVGPVRPGTPRGLTVTPDRFARQLAWLRRLGYRGASVEEVAGGALSGRRVLLTFDDAYADLEDHAFPALTAAGFPATVFAVSELLGGVNEWEPGGTGHRLLDAAGLRRWSERGVDVGAHTRTHADLTALSREQTEAEVAGSRRDLEQVLERRVRAFAYPFGRPGPWGREIAAEVFDLAFTVDPGRNRRGGDQHLIGRTMVQPRDTRLDLVQRLLLGRSPTSLARQQLGVLRQRRTAA